ncbi:MAG: hypothetical protein RLZZ299_2702 [Pseudomonadota bacterium]|jgi:hypothetical protein
MALRRARHGQATVILAMSVLAMVVLIAMMTNTGMLVNDRIRMQTAADLGTYAVAYSQAASMNDLAIKNQKIADVIKDCRRQLERGPAGGSWFGYPCDCRPTDPSANAIINSCKSRIDEAILNFAQAARYDETTARAVQAGHATAKANYAGVSATFFEDIPGSPTARGTFKTRWSTNVTGQSGTWETIAPYTQVTNIYLNYSVIVECTPNCAPLPYPLPSWPRSVKGWFYKTTDQPDIWAAGRVAGTPARRYLDVDFEPIIKDKGFFGASSTGGTDKLAAYAVAKPFDGSVGPTRGGWAQRTANVPGPRGTFLSHAIWYPKFAMSPTYRARLAGIQDTLVGSRNPARLIRDDAARVGLGGYDMSKFKH